LRQWNSSDFCFFFSYWEAQNYSQCNGGKFALRPMLVNLHYRLESFRQLFKTPEFKSHLKLSQNFWWNWDQDIAFLKIPEWF
jgi:hypothetical protein